jgi:hypothetical protein
VLAEATASRRSSSVTGSPKGRESSACYVKRERCLGARKRQIRNVRPVQAPLLQIDQKYNRPSIMVAAEIRRKRQSRSRNECSRFAAVRSPLAAVEGRPD